MKVKPIVFWKVTGNDFLIIDDRVRDLCISKYQRYCVIPGKFRFRRVHGYSWNYFQFHFLHVYFGVCDLLVDLSGLNVRYDLIAYSANGALCGDVRIVPDEESTATVIEQPFYFNIILEHPKCDSICFQMVGLILIHRNKNLRCRSIQCEERKQERDNYTFH